MQVHTFNIGIYPGAILPFIIGYWADAATAVGDITATEEASGIEERGPAHDERIQGCLLADGETASFQSFKKTKDSWASSVAAAVSESRPHPVLCS